MLPPWQGLVVIYSTISAKTLVHVSEVTESRCIPKYKLMNVQIKEASHKFGVCCPCLACLEDDPMAEIEFTLKTTDKDNKVPIYAHA